MCELRIAKKSANLWQVKIKKGSANCELRKKARTSVSDSNLWKSELRIAKKSAKNKKVRHFRDCHFGMRKRSCVSIKSGTKKVRHFRNHPSHPPIWNRLTEPNASASVSASKTLVVVAVWWIRGAKPKEESTERESRGRKIMERRLWRNRRMEESRVDGGGGENWR